MNKYQEALNKIKNMGDKDLFNEFHIEWVDTLQELLNKTTPLLDKATPMKPIIRGLSGAIHTYVHTCPVCGKELIVTNNETVIYKTKTNYCDECGQKLDWSGETYNE